MNRFWALVFLLVPIFGVATFVVAPYYHHLVPARHLRTWPRDRPVVHVHPLADGRRVHRHRRSRCSTSCGSTTPTNNREPVKFSHGSHTLEVVWTILPTVTLLFIAIYQMNAWADAKMRKPDIPVTAEITGRQFNWDVRYPGADGELYTPDDIFRYDGMIHLPANEEILLIDQERRRAAQLLPAQHADEAGRGARHGAEHVVQGQRDGRVRHRVRRALRLGPLQDEGPRRRSSRGPTTTTG